MRDAEPGRRRMPTLPSGAVEMYLRLTRANVPYVSADGARRRVRSRALRPRSYGPPRRMRPDVTVTAGRHGGWPLYTVVPARGAVAGTVVYLHGGGWVNEIASQHWHLAAQIAAEADTAVVVPIYPLVPFGTSSTTVAVVADLVAESSTRGPVCLAGDSAGGQIVLSTALHLRDEGVTVPATVLISPALDLTLSNPEIPRVQPSDPWLGVDGGRVLGELWSGDVDLVDPIVSPLFGDFTGLGPLTVFSGTRDILNPDAHLLVDRAQSAGVEVTFRELEGELHVYPILPTKTGAAARASIIDTVRRAVRH